MDNPYPDSENETSLEARSHSGGSNLKLRDVQVLNRSFKRLAEVQEALLVQMGEIDRLRTRRERWLTPLLALAGFSAAGAAGWLAWVQQNQPDNPPEIQVIAPQQEPPTIVVQPTPVTVEAPAQSSISPGAFERLLGELDSLRAESREDRKRIAELTERLFQKEQSGLAEMAAIGLNPAAVDSPAPLTPQEPEVAEASVNSSPAEPLLSPWIGALNGLLALDGYPHFRFERGVRVEGEPEISEVTLLVWNVGGMLDSVVKAETAHFELHRMAGDLVLRLENGSRTRAGARHILPEHGIRFDFSDVDVESWSRHFPELVPVGGADPDLIQSVRANLEALISDKRPSGYYRVPVLGDIDGGVLKMVQVHRYDAAGHLMRTLDADSLQVRLHGNGDVELLFRDGVIVEGGVRRPFFDDRFRAYLPRQPLDDWRASAVPFVEVE